MGKLASFAGLCLVMFAAACGKVSSSADAPPPPVDAVSIDAAPPTFSVGGMVSGLTASGLVLQNNGGDDLSVSTAGNFTFATKLKTGDSYAVTVKTQPGGQSCGVSGGTGTVGSANVTSVTVNCSSNTFTIGGTVTGIVGTAILANPLTTGTDRVTISSDGTYSFPTPLMTGTTYHVTVDTQPTPSTCYVVGPASSPGIGTVGTANVTDLDVRCVGQPTVTAPAASCDTESNAITWTDVPGATFTVSYGPQGGPLTSVNLGTGTTSYTPPVTAGNYVAHVQAHVGTLDGPVSTPDVTFHVGITPAATANNTGPSCVGGSMTLLAGPNGQATYSWTGPSGYTSTSQNPTLNNIGTTGDATGTYTVTVTNDGCSATASTTVATSSVPGSFTQNTSAQFAANANTTVVTSNNQITLTDDLDAGPGGGAFNATTNISIVGGSYDYSSFTIASGVTVTVTGTNPLIIRSTGTVNIAGILNVAGTPGTDAVTFMRAGTGGAGGPGGFKGGDGFFVASAGPCGGTNGQGPGAGSTGPTSPGCNPVPAGATWSGGGGAGHATVGSPGGLGNAAGPAYDTASITTTQGGSGGGGGDGGNNCGSGGGGGGGGFVRISAPTIIISGGINADGGHGGTDGGGSCGGGGGGSGGSIVLRTRSLTLSGSLSAGGGAGGTGYSAGGAGSVGRIRLDSSSSSITGTISPAAGVNSGLNYSTPGNSRTATIAPTNMCTWGTLTYTRAQPAGTTFTVDVLDANNVVLMSNVASGTNISTTVGPAQTVRLRANLSTTTTATPNMSAWTLNYVTR